MVKFLKISNHHHLLIMYKIILLVIKNFTLHIPTLKLFRLFIQIGINGINIRFFISMANDFIQHIVCFLSPIASLGEGIENIQRVE